VDPDDWSTPSAFDDRRTGRCMTSQSPGDTLGDVAVDRRTVEPSVARRLDHPGALDGRTTWLRRVETVAAPVALALPALIAVMSVVGRKWFPSGDQAIQLLRISEVGTRHTPLIGAYSRYGWNHPGPLQFWLSAIPYRMFGAAGVLAVTGAINGLASAGTVVAARRFGGSALAWVVTACGLLMIRSQGLTLLVDPWNPWVATLPFLAFLFSVAAAAKGDRQMLLVALAAGSFAVQAHLGNAPLVATASVMAVVCLSLDRRDRNRVAFGRRYVLLVGALALGLWAGPLIQQLTGHPRNLSAILSFFRGSHRTVGFTSASHVSGLELGLWPPWLGLADEMDRAGFVAGRSPIPLMLLIAGLLLIGFLCWRRQCRRAAEASWLSAVLLAIGTFAISRAVAGVDTYFIRWSWALGAFTLASLVWAAIVAAGSPRALAVTRATAAFIAALLVVSLASSLPVGLPEAKDGRAVAALDQQLRATLDKYERYQVAYADLRSFGSVSTGAAASLARQGWNIRLARDQSHTFGSWWTTSFDPHAPTVVIIGGFGLTRSVRPKGGTRIAVYDALSGQQRAQADRLEDLIRSRARAKASDIVDVSSRFGHGWWTDLSHEPEAVDRLAKLQVQGDRYEVWLLRPGLRWT